MIEITIQQVDQVDQSGTVFDTSQLLSSSVNIPMYTAEKGEKGDTGPAITDDQVKAVLRTFHTVSEIEPTQLDGIDGDFWWIEE
jgi:hypothetical protein